jgi:hypothetical protein
VTPPPAYGQRRPGIVCSLEPFCSCRARSVDANMKKEGDKTNERTKRDMS